MPILHWRAQMGEDKQNRKRDRVFQGTLPYFILNHKQPVL